MSNDDNSTVHTIVPAQPGWSLVRLDEGGADGLWYHDIIAWHIRGHHDYSKVRFHGRWCETWPVTTNDYDDFQSGDTLVYKKPDGTFVSNDGPRFETAEQVKVYLLENKRGIRRA